MFYEVKQLCLFGMTISIKSKKILLQLNQLHQNDKSQMTGFEQVL